MSVGRLKKTNKLRTRRKFRLGDSMTKKSTIKTVSLGHATNTISFLTEKDRINGIGTLFHSELVWSGIEKNKFIVKKEHLKLLDDKNIKYHEVK